MLPSSEIGSNYCIIEGNWPTLDILSLGGRYTLSSTLYNVNNRLVPNLLDMMVLVQISLVEKIGKTLKEYAHTCIICNSLERFKLFSILKLHTS